MSQLSKVITSPMRAPRHDREVGVVLDRTPAESTDDDCLAPREAEQRRETSHYSSKSIFGIQSIRS